MLYQLSQYLKSAPWSLLQYVTVRAGGALLTALLLSWLLGPRVIRWLGDLKFRQDYRPKDAAGPAPDVAADLAKRGTPTMGGLLIVVVLDISVLLWARWNSLVVLTLLVLVIFAGLGFYDDWMKVSRQNSDGVKSNFKLLVQAFVAAGVVGHLYYLPSTRALVTELNLPFLPAKSAVIRDLSFLSPANATNAAGPVVAPEIAAGISWGGGLVAAFTLGLSMLVIVGSSNAVNLTDGMDGLAIGCTLICAAAFVPLTYVAGNKVLAAYLLVPRVPGAEELTVICAALVGSSLGFLWYNCHPAEVFMGDTGSLALGGALGVMAVAIHQPFALLIAGAVFVAEALSVMLQVGWFKYTRRTTGTGRRIFRMSPLHHHFRKVGWAESKIVTRFYIAAILCAVLAISTLKIR